MGAEFIAGSLEELCDLMCNNTIPKRKERKKMTKIKSLLEVKNCPREITEGFEVVCLVKGSLWHYGNYKDRISAEMAASGDDNRFVVEVTE